jgi:hypothetical protein
LKFSVEFWSKESENDHSQKGAKHAAKSKRSPSINKTANSKLEIRNSKQSQMVKTQKVPNELVSDFGFCFAGRDKFVEVVSVEHLKT